MPDPVSTSENIIMKMNNEVDITTKDEVYNYKVLNVIIMYKICRNLILTKSKIYNI